MIPQWETMTNAMERYEKKEKDYDDLVRESKEKKALMKFRHVIAVFRKLVCTELHTEWKDFHLLLEKEDNEAVKNLNAVLQRKFHMSMKEWDTLSKIARIGSGYAHPTFDNDKEIAELLEYLPASTEDRELIQKLTSSLIDHWKVGDDIVERRRKSPKK